MGKKKKKKEDPPPLLGAFKGTQTETDLPGCKRDKIFHSLGHNLAEEANHDSADIFVSNSHIEEDLRCEGTAEQRVTTGRERYSLRMRPHVKALHAPQQRTKKL